MHWLIHGSTCEFCIQCTSKNSLYAETLNNDLFVVSDRIFFKFQMEMLTYGENTVAGGKLLDHQSIWQQGGLPNRQVSNLALRGVCVLPFPKKHLSLVKRRLIFPPQVRKCLFVCMCPALTFPKYSGFLQEQLTEAS